MFSNCCNVALACLVVIFGRGNRKKRVMTASVYIHSHASTVSLGLRSILRMRNMGLERPGRLRTDDVEGMLNNNLAKAFVIHLGTVLSCV